MGTWQSLAWLKGLFSCIPGAAYHCRIKILTLLPKNKTHKTRISSLDCTMSISWIWYYTIMMSGVTTEGDWARSTWHLLHIFFCNFLWIYNYFKINFKNCLRKPFSKKRINLIYFFNLILIWMTPYAEIFISEED